MFDKEIVCLQCQYKGKPKTITPGSMILELGAWLIMILPGLIYSLWRKLAQYKGCPICQSKQVVPLDSPVGRKMFPPQEPVPGYEI
jgi:hypothetical protein